MRRIVPLCLFWIGLLLAGPLPGLCAETLAPATPDASAAPVAVPQYSMGGYVRALAVLCLAVAALWFALWLFRRYGKRFNPLLAGADRNLLRVESQLSLGQRRGLVVVRFEDERLLLGVTEQHIVPLTSHEASHEAGHSARPPDTPRARTSFASLLHPDAPRSDGGADA